MTLFVLASSNGKRQKSSIPANAPCIACRVDGLRGEDARDPSEKKKLPRQTASAPIGHQRPLGN